MAAMRRLRHSERFPRTTFSRPSCPIRSFSQALGIVDGEVIPDELAAIFARGEQADVPVMIGSNADEGTALFSYLAPAFGDGVAGFEAYVAATLGEIADDVRAHYPATDDAQATESWMDLMGDAMFTWPMRAWARAMQTVPSETWLYWFTKEPPVADSDRYGAFHAAEIGYVFGNVDLFGAVPADADHALSEMMATVWTQFARTGNPNGEGLPEWPAYTAETRRIWSSVPTPAPGAAACGRPRWTCSNALGRYSGRMRRCRRWPTDAQRPSSARFATRAACKRCPISRRVSCRTSSSAATVGHRCRTSTTSSITSRARRQLA